jgi:hypothetical protein
MQVEEGSREADADNDYGGEDEGKSAGGSTPRRKNSKTPVKAAVYHVARGDSNTGELGMATPVRSSSRNVQRKQYTEQADMEDKATPGSSGRKRKAAAKGRDRGRRKKAQGWGSGSDEDEDEDAAELYVDDDDYV